MDGYEVEQAPFYTSPNTLVSAYKGLSRERANNSVVIIRHDLVVSTYKSQFPQILDAVLNTGLEIARNEGKQSLKILDIHVNFSAVPEKYIVFFALDTGNIERIEERECEATLQTLLQQIAGLLASGDPHAQDYLFEPQPFYVNSSSFVSLFKGVSKENSQVSVILKRHDFYLEELGTELSSKIANATKAGLIQARVDHAHTCKILQIRLDTSEAPKKYSLNHIMEALDRDVGKEIQRRRRDQSFMSEKELWTFVSQTAEVLAFTHAKVGYR